jgi:hypothetical protein
VFKRRTSKVHPRRQVRQLLANVMSPKIFWHDVRQSLAAVLGVVLATAVVGALGWGVWRGIEFSLFENDDFRLQRIVLQENPAVDEIRLLEVTGIDIDGSLFRCDPDQIRSRLEALPEITSARVVREFPGDLKVDLTVRKPYVWIACEAAGVAPRDPRRGLLVDRGGLLFSCPPGLVEECAGLPVLHLRDDNGGIVAGRTLDHPDYRRALRLLHVAESELPEARGWIESIELHKRWGCRLHTRDGIVATFGHDELERQMHDLLAAVEHARQKGDELATISLVGNRNLPVTFRSTAPRRVIVVPDDDAEPAGDADLNQLLER